MLLAFTGYYGNPDKTMFLLDIAKPATVNIISQKVIKYFIFHYYTYIMF